MKTTIDYGLLSIKGESKKWIVQFYWPYVKWISRNPEGILKPKRWRKELFMDASTAFRLVIESDHFVMGFYVLGFGFGMDFSRNP